MKQSGDLQALLVHSLLHDLKNQAHHLLNGLERATPPPSQEVEWSRLCDEARDLGDHLTNALLAIRLNRHQHGLQLEPVIVQELLEDAAEAATARSSPAGLSVQVQPCPGLSHYLDVHLLLPTLRSAVDNSTRHARSQVQLSAVADEGGLLLSVEDDGPGYPDDLLRNPDSYLTQANAEERRTGLGLLLARLVAEAHKHEGRHGKLQLGTSADLGGARFQLFLP